MLRVFLVSGLAFHKLLWELMKWKGTTSAPEYPSRTGWVKRVVKWGKAIALLLLLVQTLYLEVASISPRPRLIRLAGVAIYSLGLLVAVLGRLHLGNNWSNLEDAQVGTDQKIVTTGVYSFIRHPIYAGDLLLLLGLELALNSWLFLALALPLVVVVRQIGVEERLLASRFDGYNEYRLRTSRLVPLIY